MGTFLHLIPFQVNQIVLRRIVRDKRSGNWEFAPSAKTGSLWAADGITSD